MYIIQQWFLYAAPRTMSYVFVCVYVVCIIILYDCHVFFMNMNVNKWEVRYDTLCDTIVTLPRPRYK